MNLTFTERCQLIADDLGLEMDVYEDGENSTPFEDDGVLHVSQGNIRVTFDVSENQRFTAKKQNAITRKVMNRLELPITNAVMA